MARVNPTLCTEARRPTDLIAGAASGTLAARVERWPSGRRRTPGKCVTPNRVRGFESHPLRQNVYAVGRILVTKLYLNGDGGGGVRTFRFDSAAAALDAGGFATAPAGRGPKARVNPTLSAKIFLQLVGFGF